MELKLKGPAKNAPHSMATALKRGSWHAPEPFFDAPLTELIFLHMHSSVCSLSDCHHVPTRTTGRIVPRSLNQGSGRPFAPLFSQVCEVNDHHYRPTCLSQGNGTDLWTLRFCGPNRFGLVSEDGNTGENQKHVFQGELKGQVRY